MQDVPLESMTFALPPEMNALLADTETIRLHADRIRANGFTVIENALPLSFVEAMRDRFDVLLEEYRNSVPTNRGANRYQMYLPFDAPFSDPLLYEHPVALAVVKDILGDRFHMDYLASDTPFPGSDYQAVHSDAPPLFPEKEMPTPIYALVLNTPLVDATEENGPLEIWPGGTHNIVGVNIPKLAETMVSQRLMMKAGGILLRDPRVWHRGTPNHGTRSRPNIALVYSRPWYRFPLNKPSLRRSQFERLSEQGKAMLKDAALLEG